MERSFADLAYEAKERKTRRELVLKRTEELLPWDRLVEEIRPYCPQAGNGRAPYLLDDTLRVHCIQLFHNLSDSAMEDLLHEVESVRRFTGTRLGKVSDKTTILNFHHRLERHGPGNVLFETIKEHLADQGLVLKEGTMMDASIVAARTSRKNHKGERDPEMK